MSNQTIRTYVSHSQLDMFTRCGEAYRRRYILGEKIAPGMALLKGSGVHGMAEENFRQKIDSKEDLDTKELLEIADAKFEERRHEDGYILTSEEEKVGAKKVLGQTKDGVMRLTRLYREKCSPSIQPELVEHEIRIELPGHPTDMLGILDVVTSDGRIKDLKTSGRSKQQADADDSTQMTWYAMAYQALRGKPSAGIDLEVLVDTKTPKHQRLSTSRGQHDYEVLLARLNTMLAGREAGIFHPAPIGSWWCSAKFCGYWNTCPYVNSERKSAAEVLDV